MHLKKVEAHIQSIQPQWSEFLKAHPEMSKLELSGYTGGDGMLDGYGQLPSNAALLAVSNFLQSTRPPRPLYFSALINEELVVTNGVSAGK